MKILQPKGALEDSILIKPNEKLHLVLCPTASSSTNLNFTLSKDASLKVQFVVASSSHNINLSFELKERASLTFDGAFALAGEDKLDFNYKATHLGADSKSRFNLVGTLDDKAQKNSIEIIDFKAGATNAEGSESEKVTLFSDTAKNSAKPIILCDEENMHGTHSFSSGHLDPLVVDYLRSRGVDLATAKKIISHEQIRRVVELCKNKDIIEEILGTLQ